jgi:hypothetical protein
MPKYRIRFSEEYSGYLYFEAENSKIAQDIFDGLVSGDIFDDELSYNFDKNSKNGHSEYSDIEQVAN